MRNFRQLVNSCKVFIDKNRFIIIIGIIVLGLFFRGYRIEDRYYFAHDGDLFSWIVKDIVIDNHWRLIGQETSSSGVFIGPLFYYLLIPFFLLTSMDQIGGALFALTFSIFTLLSYYYVFKKLFTWTTGAIALLVQATFVSRLSYDIWVVPTVTTSLWEIWYFYCLMMLTKGNFAVLSILGILVALIWHINFSLAPILIAIPAAIVLSKKVPPLILIAKSFIIFIFLSIPLFLFEMKHNFIQARSVIDSFLINQGGGSGLDKLYHVMDQVSGNTTTLFLFPNYKIFIPDIYIFLALVLTGLLLTVKGAISKKMLLVMYVWILSMIVFFTFSTKIISEYYFSNLNVVFLAIFILGLSQLFYISKIGRVIVMLLFLAFLVRGFDYVTKYAPDNNLLGYNYRKQAAKFIAEDARKKGFPCVAVSYITTLGEDVGFRYFFYLNNLHVNKPPSGSPIYSIVIPYGFADSPNKVKFGMIGVIPPTGNYDPKQVKYSCSGANSNLTDSMFGYTE